MKKLNIEITKAQIKSFSVNLDDSGEPKVNCTIGLFTNAGKSISEYMIGTDSWNSDQKFDLPIEMIEPIMHIAFQLEGIVVRHCKQGQKTLKQAS